MRTQDFAQGGKIDSSQGHQSTINYIYLIISMNKNTYISVAFAALIIFGVTYITRPKSPNPKTEFAHEALAAKFEELSQGGNSSCSVSFTSSIESMPDSAHLQGSCCSAMSMHRYSDQVEGLKKYKDIKEVPSDPYDIEAGLAKKLKEYYDISLTPKEQQVYDYAMQNSHEKGPCCCKCWRWYVYGGLAKLLIQKYDFTGEQIVDIWNLSDGCGGDSEHNH